MHDVQCRPKSRWQQNDSSVAAAIDKQTDTHWQTLASALSGHSAGSLTPADQHAAEEGSAQLLADIAELDEAACAPLPADSNLIPCLHAEHGMPHISFCSVCERSMPGCMHQAHLANCRPTSKTDLHAPAPAPPGRNATPTPTTSTQSLPAIKHHPKKRRTGASKLSRQSNAMLPPAAPPFAPPPQPPGIPTGAPWHNNTHSAHPPQPHLQPIPRQHRCSSWHPLSQSNQACSAAVAAAAPPSPPHLLPQQAHSGSPGSPA